MERKIGIAIPTFNRPDLTIESFKQVHDDERIESITICDDASQEINYEKLQENVKPFEKVRLFKNELNIDCSENKFRSMWLSNSDWNILLDSDNIIDKPYIDILFDYPWRHNTILTPSFASPHFDFRAYSGLIISKENISEYIEQPMFETMCNASNFFINRDEYLKIWGDDETDPVTSDSIYFVYKWFAAGNKITVTPGLQYFHRVHPGSHYQTQNHRTPKGFHESIIQKLKNLT